MDRKKITLVFLLLVTAFALYLCYVIFDPFLNPIIAAALLAIVFFPIHMKVGMFIKRPSLAALATTTLVVLIITLPAVFIGVAIAGEVAELINIVRDRSSEAGGWGTYFGGLIEVPVAWISRYVDLSAIDFRAELLNRLEQLSGFLQRVARLIVENIVLFVVNTSITVVTLFFLFREGKAIKRRIAAVLPLTGEQTERLFSGIGDTIYASVYGGVIVAMVQGFLTGIALAIVGIPSPLFWGVIATVLAFLPIVGAAFVWLPAGIFLIAEGSWIKGLILLAWGGLVVSTIDNILRPYLISGRVRMHALLIFFSVFGGVQVFGFIGLFLGPVVVAVTMTLLRLLRDEARSWGLADGKQALEAENRGEGALDEEATVEPVQVAK